VSGSIFACGLSDQRFTALMGEAESFASGRSQGSPSGTSEARVLRVSVRGLKSLLKAILIVKGNAKSYSQHNEKA
jgi:hypothetical protein